MPLFRPSSGVTLLQALDGVYPIGSVYISTVSTNPATLFGVGTWAAFGAGRVLVGLNSGDTDFDAAEETGGAKTVICAGTVSQPTFTGSALGTHLHGTGTYAASAHAGTAVADHTYTPAGTVAAPVFTGSSGTVSAQTISWPAGVPTFAGSALATHQHELPMQNVSGTVQRFTAPATFGTGTSRAAVSTVTTTGNTTSSAVALSEAKTAGTPAGTVAWPAGVPTNGTVSFTPVGTNGAPAFTGTQATLSHSVTQPSAHTLSGSSEAMSAGTPAGTVSQPTLTGSATSVVQPYIVCYFWKRTA